MRYLIWAETRRKRHNKHREYPGAEHHTDGFGHTLGNIRGGVGTVAQRLAPISLVYGVRRSTILTPAPSLCRERLPCRDEARMAPKSGPPLMPYTVRAGCDSSRRDPVSVTPSFMRGMRDF